MTTNSKSNPQKRKKQREKLQEENVSREEALNSEDNNIPFVDDSVDVASTVNRLRRSRV